MNARSVTAALKTAGVETRRYWYYIPLLYALQVAVVTVGAARSTMLLPVLGLSAGFLVLFTVIVGDPRRDRGRTNLLIAAKLVGYYAAVSVIVGIVDLVTAVSPFGASAGMGGLDAMPSLFALIAARLTTDVAYWATVAVVLLFFMGAYRLAGHGRLRAALREGPTIFLRRPVLTGAAVVTAFLLVYLPMVAVAAVLGVVQLPAVPVAGGTVPVAAFVLTAVTSVGGVASMRFVAAVAAQCSGESSG